MQLRDALFTAIDKYQLTAKELSEKAGVSQAQISRFRKGEDLAFSTFQRLVDGLPRDAKNHFCTLLIVGEMDNQELGEMIMVAVAQLQSRAMESHNNGLDKNKPSGTTVPAA
ncbi:hypothetical protein DSM106972_095470 [Dulcicalothrix desertica PCC 7102]|uniref:HTH cro/C1-type domain-containing protein n=1 Tax=Dulcicalothrix desertica PCC 7102 TaxID=232991 RepID=A0A433UIW4_9CYAN|nr:helix-turn-helix domain-containing protein [Dulcicalothrix desertica]RUS93788.1 hypothetical protein DSM106972_095470 [Dulcicalothrix desertica PCC 7102]TWH62733.1 hypothetical protein CAL7102_00250 [Dulcicalothrix desertica PCC 7102]